MSVGVYRAGYGRAKLLVRWWERCWWACGLQAIFTASRRVRWPVASLAGEGWRLFWRWSFLDQGPQATGFRAQPRGAMPPAALRGRLRGERPRLRGEGRTLDGGGAACGSGPGPSSRRRLTEAERSGAVKPHHTLLWCGLVRLDSTGPLSLASPADATRDPEPTSVRGVGHRSGIAALTPAAAGLFETDCRVLWKNVDNRRRLSLNGVAPGPCLDPSEGRSRIPRRVGGRSQSARAGGVQPDETAPQQRVMRLDTTRPG